MPISQPMYQSQQFPAHAHVQQYQYPQFQAHALVQQMHPPYVQHQNMSQPATSPVAFTARTNFSLSAHPQEYWLLDSGSTNHMTSYMSCLQAPTPYPSTETVTEANGEGHQQGSLSRIE
ncbi:uncharacterized protein LOC126605452 [Malus sylvestris]|uniref:uncharacterized protein LOC126605452 n=1 Tax=Malus sylvestris TaxID=3752 RepID=UPI0021AC4C48|nr:uncharacterized protein LOC126605452 [Malus sylvestris]